MNKTNVSETVHQYITSYIQEHAGANAESVTDETDLVSAGTLDSFAMLSLVISLESKFDMRFTPEELTGSQVRTIGALTSLVCEKISEF